MTKNLCFLFHIFFHLLRSSSFLWSRPRALLFLAGSSSFSDFIRLSCFDLSSSSITFSQCVPIFLQDKEKINRQTGEKSFLFVFYGRSTVLNVSCTGSLLSVDHLNIRQCALAPLCPTLPPVFRPFCLAPIRHAPNWGGSEMTWRPFGKLLNVARPFVLRPCVRIPQDILWIPLGGKPKWLPLNIGFIDVMHTAPSNQMSLYFAWDDGTY